MTTLPGEQRVQLPLFEVQPRHILQAEEITGFDPVMIARLRYGILNLPTQEYDETRSQPQLGWLADLIAEYQPWCYAFPSAQLTPDQHGYFTKVMEQLNVQLNRPVSIIDDVAMFTVRFQRENTNYYGFTITQFRPYLTQPELAEEVFPKGVELIKQSLISDENIFMDEQDPYSWTAVQQ